MPAFKNLIAGVKPAPTTIVRGRVPCRPLPRGSGLHGTRPLTMVVGAGFTPAIKFLNAGIKPAPTNPGDSGCANRSLAYCRLKPGTFDMNRDITANSGSI